jgi:hypothetical protein
MAIPIKKKNIFEVLKKIRPPAAISIATPIAKRGIFCSFIF